VETHSLPGIDGVRAGGASRTRIGRAAGEYGFDPEELGMRLPARGGMRKAKVALARKLAVALHRMLADSTSFLA
jgi:hypothetical protein